jgi:uncharacterized cupredoxin-like copper-binding protein
MQGYATPLCGQTSKQSEEQLQFAFGNLIAVSSKSSIMRKVLKQTVYGKTLLTSGAVNGRAFRGALVFFEKMLKIA